MCGMCWHVDRIMKSQEDDDGLYHPLGRSQLKLFQFPLQSNSFPVSALWIWGIDRPFPVQRETAEHWGGDVSYAQTLLMLPSCFRLGMRRSLCWRAAWPSWPSWLHSRTRGPSSGTLFSMPTMPLLLAYPAFYLLSSLFLFWTRGNGWKGPVCTGRLHVAYEYFSFVFGFPEAASVYFRSSWRQRLLGLPVLWSQKLLVE